MSGFSYIVMKCTRIMSFKNAYNPAFIPPGNFLESIDSAKTSDTLMSCIDELKKHVLPKFFLSSYLKSQIFAFLLFCPSQETMVHPYFETWKVPSQWTSALLYAHRYWFTLSDFNTSNIILECTIVRSHQQQYTMPRGGKMHKG